MPRRPVRTLLSAPLRRLKAITAAVFPASNPWAALFGGGRRIERAVGDGGTNAIVTATLGWLQRNFVQAELRVRLMGADDTLTPILPGAGGAGRMLSLLEDPNPFYSWSELAKGSILSYVLDGNSYWLVIRDNRGAPIQYWWIPHMLIEPKRDEGSTEFLTHYEYTPGGAMPVRLGLDDVVHMRDGLDPQNPLKGMSRVRAVLREVYTDEEAAEYTSTLLVNMGVPGIVVSPKESAAGGMMGPGPDDIAETKSKFEQMTTGSNRGRSIIMSSPTDLQTVGFSPEQMNLKDLRRVPEERITAAIGVPAVVVGLGAGLDRSTFANMAEAREAGAEEGLVPLWGDFARLVKKRVLPEFEGSRLAKMVVDFDMSNVRVLREDEDKKVDRALRLVSGGVAKVGEAREAAGLKVGPEHDIYLRPLAVLEVPAGVKLDDEPPADRTLEYRMTALVQAGMITPNMALERLGFPAVTGGDVLRQIEQGDTAAPKSRVTMWLPGAPTDRTKARLSRAAQSRLIVALERDARAIEKGFARRLERVFGDLGKHVADAWRAQTGGKEISAGDQALVLATLRKANIPEWQRENFAAGYAAHYQGVLDQSLGTLNAQLGIEIGGVDQISVDILKEGGTRAGLVDLEQQTKDAMLRAVADGREAGLGPVEIERQIRQYVESGGPTANVSSRAMRIARTETMHAQRVSTRTAYEASGAFSTLIAWDDRVGYGDPDCVARNGQEFAFDEAGAEEAEEHPNGTLSWAPGEVA